MRPSLTLFVVALEASGCYAVAGLGDFAPAGEGGAGSSVASSTATDASTGAPGSSGTGATCDHVLLTEIRSANGDMVELFNPTEGAVDLEGWKLLSLTGAGMPQTKWTGAAGATVAPGGYFLVAVPTVEPRDGDLTGFATTGLTVARLVDANDVPIDAVCVCDAPGCQNPLFETECSRALVVPMFSTRAATRSAQRARACLDADDSSLDFVDACPTPRADVATAATVCP